MLEWVPCRLPRQTKGWVIPSSGTISDISRSFVLKAASETCMNVVRKQKASKLSERMLVILAPISELLHVPDFMPRCTRVFARSSQVSWVSHAFICFSFCPSTFLGVNVPWPAELQPSIWQISDQQEPPRPWWQAKKEDQKDATASVDRLEISVVRPAATTTRYRNGSCSSNAIESWWMKPAHDFCHGWKWDCFHIFEIAVPLIHYLNVSK